MRGCNKSVQTVCCDQFFDPPLVRVMDLVVALCASGMASLRGTVTTFFATYFGFISGGV